MRKNFNDTEVSPESNPIVPADDLAMLIESYIVNKQNEKIYKDNASAENTQIKEVMHERGITKFETSLGTASITEQKKETFIEESLIEFLKANNVADNIVKTKEYVDYDALENAIYHDLISPDVLRDMNKCKETKITTVLRIKEKS